MAPRFAAVTGVFDGDGTRLFATDEEGNVWTLSPDDRGEEGEPPTWKLTGYAPEPLEPEPDVWTQVGTEAQVADALDLVAARSFTMNLSTPEGRREAAAALQVDRPRGGRGLVPPITLLDLAAVADELAKVSGGDTRAHGSARANLSARVLLADFLAWMTREPGRSFSRVPDVWELAVTYLAELQRRADEEPRGSWA